MSTHPLSADDAEAARRYQELFKQQPPTPETHSEMGVILRKTGLSEHDLLEQHPEAA